MASPLGRAFVGGRAGRYCGGKAWLSGLRRSCQPVYLLFIEKAAYDIFKDAIDKMVDKACDENLEDSLKHCALEQEGVLGVGPSAHEGFW